MTILTTNVEKWNGRIGDKVFNRYTPSGTTILEDLLDFVADIDPSVLGNDDLAEVITLFTDLEYLTRTDQLNEGMLKHRKSTSIARIIARRWYSKNKGRVKKLQARIKKSKGLMKKKEIRAKSKRSLTGKKQKRYNTKDHVLDSISRKISKNSKQIVEKWFAPVPYRVIKAFTVDDKLEANLYERIEHIGNDSWRLIKRNGESWRLTGVERKQLESLIKHEALVEVSDFV